MGFKETVEETGGGVGELFPAADESTRRVYVYVCQQDVVCLGRFMGLNVL